MLIGELPIPVVHNGSKAFLSVYPYVDFEKKSFVYDATKGYYDHADSQSIDEKPEIWHSVIRPNAGNPEKDHDQILGFFDKTHDFYGKQGDFSSEHTLQEPRVFYFDGVHDEKTSGATNWKLYAMYLKYIEDIAYNRYNKYLAKTLYEASQKLFDISDSSIQDPEIQKILDENSGATMDLTKNADITTKQIIEKATKQFFDVFNTTYMGDILRFVHNAGRYGDDTNVRVDSVPVQIAKNDIFMKHSLKDTNTVLEDAIDAVVKGGLSRNIPVFKSYTIESIISSTPTADAEGNLLPRPVNIQVFKNYFF